MRFQAHRLVFVVVVPREHAALRIGQTQKRIERRLQAAGKNLGHDFISGAASELKHILVARLVDAAIDD
jgi:uncharacterized protein YbbK (DUF523 family)